MKRFLLIIALVFSSCSHVQFGDKNDAGYSYHFNSVTGENSNLGTKEKPFKSLDFLNNIKWLVSPINRLVFKDIFLTYLNK